MINFIKTMFAAILQLFSPAEAVAGINIQQPQVARIIEMTRDQELLFDDEQIHCAALNIYFEARNQPREGQVAVAMVVYNRAKDKFWPGNICDVIKQGSYTTGRVARNRCQFSWYCDGLSDRPKEPTTWSDNLEVARSSYYMWSNGYDITGGATNYHSVNVYPDWRADRGMTFLRTINDHHFYYWKRKVSVALK
tara:strand:+ start:444 stop:1025 length:582 start_codon:yes stop_codon:yes gene_type:complete